MRKIIIAIFTSFVLFSCGDDPVEDIKESWFAPYERQWVATDSDYFGIGKGPGTYYYFFENGVVNHYVDNGKLKGIIFTWGYSLSEVDGIKFIELLVSDCWNSDQGGFFEVHTQPDGFKLISVDDRSSHDFSFTTPDFELIFEDNGCAEISNEWMDNYSDAVMASTNNDHFNRVVFKDGIAYTKAQRFSVFTRAFSYKSLAENDREYLEILDVCPDYNVDFGIISGLYDVKEYNNNGEGNNGFEIIQGSIRIVYLEDLLDYPDVLDQDCYTSIF